MVSKYIFSLSDQQASIEMVGGKGYSLTRLAGAGFPVPGGFTITTAAYQYFVGENSLQPVIDRILGNVDPAQPSTLESASQAIRECFLQGTMPVNIKSAIDQAYHFFAGGTKPVAVRSSATAEDLPEASFAGQQETYLNICELEALLVAVKKSWASLWTARAISYRIKNQIDHQSVALAVVVQELIFADTAGILFTANPVNGRRDEIVINAAWGLGEALVSGMVTPDTVIIKKGAGKIIKRETVEKQVMTIRTAYGTQEIAVSEDLRKKPSLNDSQAIQLARLSERIESLYGMPMDIEWALAGETLFILQARPITSLPPEWVRPHPKAIYARGSLAEHLPNPVTPLFATLGLRAINQATVELSQSLNFDALETEYQYRSINGYVYMGFLTSPGIMFKMVKGSMKAMNKMFSLARQRWVLASQRLDEVMSPWEAIASSQEKLRSCSAQELLAGAGEVYIQLGRLYTVLQAGTLPAATSSEFIFSRVYQMVRRKGDPDATAFMFGFDTVPMKSEKALFDLAMLARQHSDLEKVLLGMPASNLVGLLEANHAPDGVSLGLWQEWASKFSEYQRMFGGTVYQLDFANPTPGENPEPALDAIKMYLNGQGQNPYERQHVAVELREQSEKRILSRLVWPVKGWFKKSLQWVQEAGPAREDSLVDLGKANPIVRKLLGEIGRRLAAGSAIAVAEDIYWLEEQEVTSLCSLLDRQAELTDMRSVVIGRQAIYNEQMKLTPPVVVPERSSWGKIMPWHKTDQYGNTIKGVGTSAGRVTAPACVLLSPSDFSKMKPGAVLVAVTTTPAWTPLFTMASAVVTDIGGPLSHSSIVAREYGIPAVMATGMATRRIQNGQRITVDGNTGVVMLEPCDGDDGKQAR